jgi:hypothetical protein
MVPDYSGIGEVPFDVTRQRRLFRNAFLEQMRDEGDAGFVWRSDNNEHTQAITMQASARPPPGQEVHVPETITFHPSWIEHQRTRRFAGWSQESFDEVTAADAMSVFKQKGDNVNADIRPIDGLLDRSFDRNMFHEVW